MALQTDIGSRIPEGVVRLTKDEALFHQQVVIRDWPSEADVCFLRYGRHMAGACNAVTSFVITNYIRNYLKGGFRASLLTFVPSVIVPSLMGYTLTDRILTNNILLMKMSCPICHQMKFALSQFYIGIGFPALYGYISFAGLAMITKSYPLPNLDTQAREFWKVSFGILKEGTRRFHITGLIQSILVLFLPYLQNKQLMTVMSKLREQEKAMEDSTSM